MSKYEYPPPAAEDLSYTESLEIMRMVHEHYRMDIEQIWKRGTVYLTISSALFALISSKDFDSGVSRNIVILFGFIISLFWLINAFLSQRWIGVWRDKLTKLDAQINPYRSFVDGEDKGGKFWSTVTRPQSYAVLLAALSIALWGYLGLEACLSTGKPAAIAEVARPAVMTPGRRSVEAGRCLPTALSADCVSSIHAPKAMRMSP